mmetsp:Transcript_69613/g.193722  ORF Transcript_69613/g.193722 Transcript_69613/m.193722 type:complete len:251 (-) Transcript_69613:4188-4940(-)
MVARVDGATSCSDNPLSSGRWRSRRWRRSRSQPGDEQELVGRCFAWIPDDVGRRPVHEYFEGGVCCELWLGAPHQCHDAGDVRASHRSATQCPLRRIGTMARRDDFRARGEDVDASADVAPRRPPVGRPRCAHSDCRRDECWSVFASVGFYRVAVVPGCDHHRNAFFRCLVNGDFNGAQHDMASQTHAHNRRLARVRCHPIHGCEEPTEGATVVRQDLHRVDRRLLGNAIARAADRARAMRAMALPIRCA